MKGQIGSKSYCQSNCRKCWIWLDGIGRIRIVAETRDYNSRLSLVSCLRDDVRLCATTIIRQRKQLWVPPIERIDEGLGQFLGSYQPEPPNEYVAAEITDIQVSFRDTRS